ncbi:MAG: hypothetical protein QXE06_09595, partial [Candidatus Bathyarchaeia archaeon]
YHVLTNVLKFDDLRQATDIDRAYNRLSKKFFGFCKKLLRLDVQQNYFAAVLSFIAGAVVIVLIAVLGG